MKNQDAIDSLALQHQRLTTMLRDLDGGIWWSSNAAADLNADKIKAQADLIGLALDELSRLIKQIGV